LQRSFTIDVLKMFAAQMIVWHHIAAYGLIAETLKLQWPVLMNTIYDQARLAVQIFLVVAGYLAAQSLSHRPVTNLLSVWGKRYSRLALPFIVALLWVMMTVALTRPFIHSDWLPEAPQALQFFAHVFFLSELLDFPALSSGVWYVAIDFQLYALLALMVFFFRPKKFWHRAFAQRTLSVVVAAMCLASLYWFNRLEAWDDWAIYFFGSYGLGVLAGWAKQRSGSGSGFNVAVFAGTWVLGALSLFVAFRSRICLALITSLLLYWRAHIQAQWGHLQSMVHRLANSSYALFLTHFGVIVLFNALWTIEHFTHPLMAVCFALLAWLCSVAIGLLFHERVETALQQWRFGSDRFNFWRATN
jgi:peptidoglycan/LPS O-acetylase OafA/YrhL